MTHPTSPTILVADDALFEQHRSRAYHPERPERLLAARRAVDRVTADGLRASPLPPRDATDAELLRAHAPAYLDELMRLAGRYAALDADTYLAPPSVAAARRAAGGAIALALGLLEGDARQGVALLRPPGHHATRDQGMGFCLLNNVAIAAHAAMDAGARVAIVDWDVHHGNGTQDILWREDRALFVSLHEMPLYPGTGATTESGEGEGRGHIVNVPLAAGATDAVYRLAFAEVVLPALAWFAPDLVLVSAGFDAHERDPLASMQLTEAGYGWMAAAIARTVADTAGGRVGLVLEGGYDLTAIEGSLAAAIRGITRPEGASLETGAVSALHREEIAAAKRAAEEAREGGPARE